MYHSVFNKLLWHSTNIRKKQWTSLATWMIEKYSLVQLTNTIKITDLVLQNLLMLISRKRKIIGYNQGRHSNLKVLGVQYSKNTNIEKRGSASNKLLWHSTNPPSSNGLRPLLLHCMCYFGWRNENKYGVLMQNHNCKNWSVQVSNLG